MDIRDLEYVIASADTENFGRAAAALRVNVSTISRRISRIEDELGLALFERMHAGVRLTAGGRAVISHVRRALAEVEAIKRSSMGVGSGNAGEVRLGLQVPPVGGRLGELLGGWHERHPGVTLSVAEFAETDLARAVEARNLDVVVTPCHAIWPHAASVPLYRERLLAVLPEGLCTRGQQTVNWDELRRHSLLIQDWENTAAGREFYSSFLGPGANILPQTASKRSVLALVRAGFGIALAMLSEAEAAFPGVVFKAIDDPSASVQMVLAWHAELEDPVVGKFVACLRDAARSTRFC